MTTTFRTERHGQTEVGIVDHDGTQFRAAGASTQGIHVTGYHGKGYTLTGWGGRVILDCRCSGVGPAGTFRNHDGETTEALVFRLANGRAIVGYSLGEGMLFRGELCYRHEDFDARALDVSRHWLEADAEDAERFAAELEAEGDDAE